MTEPEIDEAAAVEFFEYMRTRSNHARAALAWKARAEAAEAHCKALEGEIDRLRSHGIPCDCKDCR